MESIYIQTTTAATLTTAMLQEVKNAGETSHSCYNFCPKCGIDTTQFSHEDTCPHALTA